MKHLFISFIIMLAAAGARSQNRLSLPDGREAFLSGINVAWANFAGDVGNNPINEANWSTMLDEVKNAGGNTMRWWLYTNAAQSPVFDASGYVSGMGTQTVNNVKKVLDMAQERDMVIILCLYSFDLLQNQTGVNLANNKKMLNTDEGIKRCIDNSITPLVTAIGKHPAIACWEIFNEPEGMTTEFGWSTDKVSMYNIQRFVNRAAGAVHRAVPGMLVSNGSWNMKALCDKLGHKNYYADAELVAAGNDADGYLDFFMVHYYNNDGGDNTHNSPFHHTQSYWGLDKDIVVAEFSAHGFTSPSLTPTECHKRVFDNGYAGVLSWKYNQANGNDDGHGDLGDAAPGIAYLWDNYPEYISLSSGCAPLENTLVNKNATPQTVALKHYLDSVYNNTNKRISGQMDERYLPYILTTTGKEPAIMGYDFDGICPSQTYKVNTDAAKAINWVKNRGGIAQFSWHWISPDADGDYYYDKDAKNGKTDFNLAAALADKTGQSYQNIVRDIDIAAGELLKLQQAGVPVLWRPLHEAEGRWFWWGAAGGDACKELYRIMYDRMTNTHKLNNLIWVWTSYGSKYENWYPGDDVVDMIVWDYPESEGGSNAWNQYQSLFGSKGKLFGIGEEGTLADPAGYDAQPWLYFLTWAYMVEDPADNPAQGKNSKAWLTKVYNDAKVINLNNLPDWNTYGLCGSGNANRRNLALNKPVTASSTEPGLGNIAANATDGNRSTRWSSEYTDPQSITVDLEDIYYISDVALLWEAAFAKSYTIDISQDNVSWQTVFTELASNGATDAASFAPVPARYVRMSGLTRSLPAYGYSLFELEVYGANMALNKNVSVSSTEAGWGNTAPKAVDGDYATRWSSEYSDPQWIVVDMGLSARVYEIVLRWEDAYASVYAVETSADSVQWQEAYRTDAGKGGAVSIALADAAARYIRISGSAQATAYGYSLYEIEAYCKLLSNSQLVQSIGLRQGWNLISLNVEPAQSSITDIFDGLDVSEIKTADAYWRSGQADFLNTLFELAPGAGYLVLMESAGTLTVKGSAAGTAVFPPAISQGWQLAGVPFQAAVPIGEYFNSANCQAVKNFEGYWLPGAPASSISTLKPGEAYFIKK